MSRSAAVPSDRANDGAADPGATGEPRPSGRSPRRVRTAPARPRQHDSDPDRLELWQRTSEPYFGAVVLEDLEDTRADAAAAQRVLARFAALRLVLLVLDGAMPKRDIAEERTIAEAYVHALPAADAERRALARMIAAAASSRRREIAIQALEAAEHATRQGHAAGAFWLYRAAYTLGHANQWMAESLRAATALAAAARAGHARKAARTWRRRARTIEKSIAEAERRAAAEE